MTFVCARETDVMSDKKRCEIPSMTLGPCDLEYGHDGDMHASRGDGFYAQSYLEEHKQRQKSGKHKIH